MSLRPLLTLALALSVLSPTPAAQLGHSLSGSAKSRPPQIPSGPGLGNFNYDSAQLFQPLSVLKSPSGHGRPALVKGWLMMIFSSDGGGTPNDGGIEFWDVSEPVAPLLVKRYDNADTHGLREAHGYAFSRGNGRDLLALQSVLGVQIWDITDPMNLSLSSEIDLPGINGGDYEGVWWVAWQPPYMYAAGRSNGLFIIDTSDPDNPVLVKQLLSGTLGGLSPGMVYVVGNLMVLAQPQSGAFATLDISSPLNPMLLSQQSFQNGYSHLFAAGKLLTSGGDGSPTQMFVYDVSPAGVITPVGAAGSGLGNGGYGSWQDGFFHSGFSSQYAKFDVETLTLIGTGTSGLGGADEDFAQVLGNLVLVGNDHVQGSALIVHDTLPDTTGPQVDWVHPPDGATELALTTRVGLSLSDQVDPDSAHMGTFRLRAADGTLVPGRHSVQQGLVNFSPVQPLQPNTTYQVEVSGLRDAVGNVGGAFSSSFTTATPAPPQLIENLSANSGKTYGTGSFSAGELVYVDRPYTYTANHPAALQDQPYILTANDDKNSLGAGFLSFDLSAAATVSVLYDSRATQFPAWLDGWAQGAETVEVSEQGGLVEYLVFSLDHGPGPVALGGNQDAPATGAQSNYMVVVLPATPPSCTLNSLQAALSGSAVDVSAVAGGSAPLSYSWNFGDGTPPTAASPSPNASHFFAQPGRYPVILTVSNPLGSSCCSAIQIVYDPLTPLAPATSTPIAFSNGRSYNVNPDNDTVTAIDEAQLSVAWEVPVGDHPRTLAQTPTGEIWVVVQDDALIRMVDPTSGVDLGQIPLPRGSKPYGIAVSPDQSAAYVTLEATGELWKLDWNGVQLGSITLGAAARGIAITADSQKVLVTRFVSPSTHGEVWQVDAASMTLDTTITLAFDPGPDTENSGRGVPNYLTALRVSPDGKRALVPSKKDNVARGLFLDGLPLTFESRTRTIVSQLDLLLGVENLSARLDLNDRAMAQAASFSLLGDLSLVATQGTNTVEVLDANANTLLATLPTGRSPQGLVFNDDGSRLFVHNFMSRSVSVFDTQSLLAGTSNAAPLLLEIPTVTAEALTAQVLLGKQLFYDAEDPRLSLDGYISCAGCHLDQGSDGQIWDFTQSGEGLRNTIDLFGRAGTGHGNVHWTANFDEIQDFENDIRNGFSGTGLMTDPDFAATAVPLGPPKAGLSTDLDALAAYVTSLTVFPDSPFRDALGNLTPDAVAGQALFTQLSCAQCHPAPDYTDGLMHDVGTLQASSGPSTTAIDTPTLRGLWASPPYLHNGQAATLSAVLNSAQHGATQGLTAQQRAQLEAFLIQLE